MGHGGHGTRWTGSPLGTAGGYTERYDLAHRGRQVSELLVGRHAVLESLRARRRHYYRLWLEGDGQTAPKGSLAEIVQLAHKINLPTRHVEGGIFDRIRRAQLNPQGVALETGPFPYAELDDILSLASRKSEPLLLVLDHLEDPRNLGTLFR
ncbi:MAG: hypothetical protein F4047_00685, partial [Caldilineaceae bacterium SB0670_bin_27]|nr:hypothetical protein [Caldilineaceae bacterium SB0670_bin_27]